MATLSHHPLFAKTDDKDKLPPMVNEPNQAEIDAETARRLREAAEERRTGKQSSNYLVAQLRAGYANDNPACFCQCGKFCPSANACIPVRGAVHQPYWTLREVATPRGRAWVACLYDPQAERFLVHTLYSRLYPTPCAAADTLVAHALRTQTHPIRLDHGQFCRVDLSGVERQMAQALYDAGYAIFLAHVDAPDLRHPLMVAGYAAAQAEAEAAIAEQHPGFVWTVSTQTIDPDDANYVPFQMPKEAYSGVMFDYQRDDYVGA